MKHLLLASLIAVTTAPATFGGTIEKACLRSDRKAASRSLCGCIQEAANLTLSGSDQRLAAKFFRDPHQAQVIRQSDRSSHEAFWKRYKQFGVTAETFCR